MPPSRDTEALDPPSSQGRGSPGIERGGADLRIILAVQALRAFTYGFASVVLGASLAQGGLSDFEVGLVFAARRPRDATLAAGH